MTPKKMASEFFLKHASDLLESLVKEFIRIRAERQAQIDELEKTFGLLEHLLPYYVIPDGQNVNPADLDEDSTGLIARNNIFRLLESFFSGAPRFSHAFILSDAGMGKSSLLVMLKLMFLNKFIAPPYQIVLIKIGPDTLSRVVEIEKPQNTILLLDALDEDPEAWANFYPRLQALLHSTKAFRKVVITCRTQFFPAEYEEDGRVPGQITLSGFHCSKLFLSPFTIAQVDEYLGKRFSDEATRRRARDIVTQMHSLKFRPMLLSYVDFLLEGEQPLTDMYSIYEALVSEWLNREIRKGIIDDKATIFEVCMRLAGFGFAAPASATELAPAIAFPNRVWERGEFSCGRPVPQRLGR